MRWPRSKDDPVEAAIRETAAYYTSERRKEYQAEQLRQQALRVARKLAKKFWRIAERLNGSNFPLTVHINEREYSLQYETNGWMQVFKQGETTLARLDTYIPLLHFWGSPQTVSIHEISLFIQDLDDGLVRLITDRLLELYTAEYRIQDPEETEALLARGQVDEVHLRDTDILLRAISEDKRISP